MLLRVFGVGELFGDVGADLGSPVSLDYFDRAPFKFTGKINKLTFKLEPEPKAAPEPKAELGATAAPEPDPIDTSKR